MLLVDDHQSQFLEAHVGMQQAVGGDDDVHRALFDAFEHGIRLFSGTEARQRFDPHRPVREAVAEIRRVLFGQQGRGHQHRHLFTRLRGDERRAHGHLGLAEAHVAADHAIHGLLALEIDTYLAYGLGLVGGFFEREAAGEGLVFLLTGGQRGATPRLALRVQVEQFRGHVADLVGGTLARLGPLIGPELVQRRALGRGARIARDQVQLLHGHVELVATGVLEHHELAVLSGHLHDLQADVASHSVFFVNHGRTRPQGGEIAKNRLRIGGGAPAATLLARPLSKELRFAEYRNLRCDDVEARHLRRHRDGEVCAALDELVPARGARRRETGSAQHLQQHFAAAGRIGGQQHAARKVLHKDDQRRQRLFGTQVHAPLLRRGRREVEALRRIFDLEALVIDARERAEARLELGGREVQLVGREHRAFDVVAAFLVSLGHHPGGSFHRSADVGGRAHHRLRR